MTDTIIKVPGLTPGLSYTISAYDPDELTALQTGIALTLADDVTGSTGTGAVTASVAQQALWVVKHGANFVETSPRIRTIADDAGPYTILSGLDSDGIQPGTFSPATVSSDTDYTTLFGITYDELGQPENGVDITIALTAGDGTPGVILDTKSRTATSATVNIDGTDVVGYFEFARVRIGTTWSVVRGSVSASAASPFAVRSTGTPGSVVVATYPSQAITQVLGNE